MTHSDRIYTTEDHGKYEDIAIPRKNRNTPAGPANLPQGLSVCVGLLREAFDSVAIRKAATLRGNAMQIGAKQRPQLTRTRIATRWEDGPQEIWVAVSSERYTGLHRAPNWMTRKPHKRRRTE